MLQATIIVKVQSARITNVSYICLRLSEVLSCFVLTFAYEGQEDANGVFNPSLPVRVDVGSSFFIPNDVSVYVSVRNVCRSNPNETRIYGTSR